MSGKCDRCGHKIASSYYTWVALGLVVLFLVASLGLLAVQKETIAAERTAAAKVRLEFEGEIAKLRDEVTHAQTERDTAQMRVQMLLHVLNACMERDGFTIETPQGRFNCRIVREAGS